ncbi:MAG: ATP-binding protein [Planctomycetota bacterium]|nr:ATP-binding protein [Planctomycetota bacterium]
MLRSQLFWRVFAACSALVFLVVTAGGVLASQLAKHRLSAETADDLHGLMWISALSAAAFGVLVAALLAARIAWPFRAAAARAESLVGDEASRSGGDVPEDPDEVGRLSRALGRIATLLRERQDIYTKGHSQLLAVLGGMVEGVIVVDPDEKIVHINEAAQRILGTNSPGGTRKWIWEFTEIRALIDAVARAVRQAVEVRGEIQIPGEAKDQFIEFNASPLRGERGEPAGAVLVLHDITRLRQLEHVRTELVANVSHELKTPVTAIRGLVETLHDDDSVDSELRKRFLGKALSQCQRLSTLVTDLLTLSRLESVPDFLERHPVDLGAVINEVAHSLHGTAQRKGIAADVSLPERIVEVLGDTEALHEVVANLLDNAIKYTPEGGRVEIRLETRRGRAVLEVEDTGIGIGSRHQERVFERFYRVDKARSRELGGTGLGLSIVKHIVLSLEGQVSVESIPGQGSTFRVDLPQVSRDR